MGQAAGELGRCRSCGAKVLWAINQATGRLAPLNATVEPENGNAEVFEVRGQLHYRILSRDESRAGKEVYLSHYATCPQAGDWRTRAPRAQR